MALLPFCRTIGTLPGRGESMPRRPEAVSRWANRGAELRQESEEFVSAFETLDRAIATARTKKLDINI